MDIKILYDNDALEGFRKGWGFSCLIEMNDTKILFDTGNGRDLLFNLKKFDINPREIQYVILSHPHHDHVGGLGHLLQITSDLTVVVPSFFPVKFKLQLMSSCQMHETFGHEQILKGVFVDTAINHLYEQFCMVKLDQGLLIVTGCAHPGLERIINRVTSHDYPIFGVLGGFHGFRKLGILKNLFFIGSCHCTSYKAEILQRFPTAAHSCVAGAMFQF
ncbi:MAG: MBL fold metallo-hydrolase [Candidatus Helarchaeota archaeon]|nr:MBL fold metallo-hydrolase [Candidatus Helarchaeota archaeon]